nr:MAG TPA: hypothetical protein [Caudoviricetes sp.]
MRVLFITGYFHVVKKLFFVFFILQFLKNNTKVHSSGGREKP